MAMTVDPRIAPYLGRILDADGSPAGTCFQVVAGVLVTAWHVLDSLGAGAEGAIVRLDPLQGGGPVRDAKVERADSLHDLAVLVTGEPLAGCVAGMAASDEVAIRTEVIITGVPVLDDPGRSYRWLDAEGHWGGGTTRDDQVPLGRVVASAVMKGMSGAPVMAALPAQGRPLVVGVVSARYNSIDGWGRDSVWAARTEDLVPLLAGLGEVSMARRGWAGAVELTLSVTGTEVRLRGSGSEVTGAHGGITSALADAMRGLRAGRVRRTVPGGQDSGGDVLPLAVEATSSAVGQLLAEAFLPGPVAAALGEVVADAERRWAPVRLGIEVGGELAALPWEALALPGTLLPLALHPLLAVYRQLGSGGVPPPEVPGPLRVLIAISAPVSGGGGILDYERELRNMLAAVRGARQGQARVRIVHFANTSEIRAALADEPAHVLHLSGHGLPGSIELEDDDGNARVLDAQRFVAEAIPPGRMPRVIALSACYSDTAAGGDRSFAAALMGLGAPVVIGTETAVTDVYATRVFSRIYGELADAPVPEVIAAVAQARRAVQQELAESPDPRDQLLARLGEWAVLTVLAVVGSVTVIDPAAESAVVAPDTAARGPQVPPGLLARDAGEFVGRRRAQRRWPAELLGPTGAGLVLYGIGGVGKTTLAAELIRRIAEREPDRLPVIAASSLKEGGGAVSVDRVLSALARALHRRSDGALPGVDRAADRAEQPDRAWQERLDELREDVLDVMPVLIVLDNFEDNLTPQSVPGRPGWRDVADQDLAALLASLAVRPGRCRLLITSRHPFVLPGQAERALSFQPIGPLTLAETMKLAWALPALDKLTEAELEQVWRMVGGHPRCLEYLDALLAGGHSHYPDVTARLAANLATRQDIPDLDEWFSVHGTLDQALAETLTLAADEILLDQLLAGLATTPEAEDLLLGLSVYRSPVDQVGLLFQAGTPDPAVETSPDYAAANEQVTAILAAAGISVDQLRDPAQLPAAVLPKLRPHLAVLNSMPTPPLRAPDSLRRLVDAGTASSLLAVDADHDPARLFVHRWTASKLQQRWDQSGRRDQLNTAHLHAAQYWQWRVQVWPQDRASDLDDLIEARYHLLTAAQTEQADKLTWTIALTLHVWGAWDREDALIRDTLAQLPDDADGRSKWIKQLGDIARGRGRITDATQLYQQALAIDEQLTRRDPDDTGFQRNLATSYNSLADLARDAGNTGEAERLYRQGLAISERLARLDPGDAGFQRDLSFSYNRLAELARDAGNTGEAERLYRQGLAISERLARLDPGNAGFQRDLSFSYDKLAQLARDAGNTGEAERLYRQALPIDERLTRLDPENTGFQQYLAISYNRLADLARDAGNTGEAERLYRQALAISERLARLDPDNTDFQRGLSVLYDKLAQLARDAGNAGEAERLYRQALPIDERLARLDPDDTSFQRNLAISYNRLGDLARDAGNTGEAERLYRQGLAIRERLARLDPDNTTFQSDLATSYNGLGDLARAAGNTGEAERLYRQALAISERLARLDPGNAGFQQSLSVFYDKLAQLARDAGNAGEAERLYRQALPIDERLARLDPGNTSFQRNLAISYNRLGDLARDAGNTGEAERLYRQDLAIRERLARLDPGNTTFQRDLVFSYNSLASLASDGADPAGALSIYRHALDFSGQIYGTDHPLTQAIADAISRVSENKAG
jgi:tetratricopeptide (TPR) repeat protein